MKNLIFLFALLLGFVSCEEELPPPTPDPVPVVGEYDRITISSDWAHDISVDSIVYLNLTTNVKQVTSGTSVTGVSEVCDGIDHKSHNLNLNTNYTSGDGCNIKVYFTPSQGPKIFSVLLLKESENQCDGAAGNGASIPPYSGDVYEVTKNL